MQVNGRMCWDDGRRRQRCDLNKEESVVKMFAKELWHERYQKNICRFCMNATKTLVKDKRERQCHKAKQRLVNKFEANTKPFWKEVKKTRKYSAAYRMIRIKSKDG